MARRVQPIEIGEAARRIGVSAAALRLYERRGLLPAASRSAGNYRQYSDEDLRRARLVRRARRAGFSLRQIAEAFARADDEAALHGVLVAHANYLDRERRRFARMHRHLWRWLAAGTARRNPHEAPVDLATLGGSSLRDISHEVSP